MMFLRAQAVRKRSQTPLATSQPPPKRLWRLPATPGRLLKFGIFQEFELSESQKIVVHQTEIILCCCYDDPT